MTNNCHICNKPITSIEVIINSETILCQDCCTCLTCHKQVSIDEIRTCLSNKRVIKHDICARVPRRRCNYLDNHGQQCDTWFPAISSDKLCDYHKGIIHNNGTTDRVNEEEKVRYIDLVNDQREYCYHFLDGTAQHQDKTLIYEFRDDEDGTKFEKLERHIAFLEKVKSDISARTQSARASLSARMDELTEEQRTELRKQKIDKSFKQPKEKIPSLKKDPIGYLMKSKGMNKSDAMELASMDTDALLAKFEAARAIKENKSNESK
jgi:hypothetical protein